MTGALQVRDPADEDLKRLGWKLHLDGGDDGGWFGHHLKNERTKCFQTRFEVEQELRKQCLS